MDINSVYLWVLPMFHAGGWTYPWAATFAVSTQITLRNVSYPLIWNHLCNSSVTHYCGAPTVQVRPRAVPRALRPHFDARQPPNRSVSSITPRLQNCQGPSPPSSQAPPRPLTSSHHWRRLGSSLSTSTVSRKFHLCVCFRIIDFAYFSQRGKLRPYIQPITG